MNNRFLTIEDLVNYFEENKIFNFSSNQSGSPIVIQAKNGGYMTFSDVYTENEKMYAPIRVCHTLLNRNKSYISEENMKRCMSTLKYSPLLAKIHQLDDGSWDFHSHDMHIEADENGDSFVVYDEQQIGTFTSDEPELVYDEELDKTYVTATVVIPEEYTRAADIIRKKGGTKVSCELVIYECSYNAKEKYLELTDFSFSGCTCLGSEKDGTEIQEGMEGSRISLENFSVKNNSIVNKIFEQIDALKNEINNLKKGGGSMDLFEELLTKYGKTIEDIDFDYENMGENELKEKFKSSFGDIDGEDVDDVNNPESLEVVENDPEDNSNENFEKLIRTYEISHEDIRYALYNLLSAYEEADNDLYFINAVYDDYFAYENWVGDKIYGQKYTTDNDTVAFDGERYVLHRELLTDSEYAALQSMRDNYDSLVEFKENTEKNIEHSRKKEIINSEKYSEITDKDKDGNYKVAAFAELVDAMDNYSIEDFETKVKVIYSDFIINHKEEKEKIKSFINLKKEYKPKKKYGDLFDNK